MTSLKLPQPFELPEDELAELENELHRDIRNKDLLYRLEILGQSEEKLGRLVEKNFKKMHDAIEKCGQMEMDFGATRERVADLLLRVGSIVNRPTHDSRSEILKEFRKRSQLSRGLCHILLGDTDQKEEHSGPTREEINMINELADRDANAMKEKMNENGKRKREATGEQRNGKKPKGTTRKANAMSQRPAASGAFFYGMMPSRSVLLKELDENDDGSNYIPVDDAMPSRSVCYWCEQDVLQEDNFDCACVCCSCGNTRSGCSQNGECKGFFFESSLRNIFMTDTVETFRSAVRNHLKPNGNFSRGAFQRMMEYHEEYVTTGPLSKMRRRNPKSHPFHLACPFDSVCFEKGEGNFGMCNPCRSHQYVTEARKGLKKQ